MTTETDHAKGNAEAWLETIKEHMAAVGVATDSDAEEAAETAINESPLSVEVRSGWHAPGASEEAPAEYCILLSTGGPALRIVGRLTEHCEPESAALEYQDWGTPWTEFLVRGDDYDALMAWVRRFYFGE